jgi:hypothetical protein
MLKKARRFDRGTRWEAKGSHTSNANEEHGALGKKWEMRKSPQLLREAVAAEAPWNSNAGSSNLAAAAAPWATVTLG